MAHTTKINPCLKEAIIDPHRRGLKSAKLSVILLGREETKWAFAKKFLFSIGSKNPKIWRII